MISHIVFDSSHMGDTQDYLEIVWIFDEPVVIAWPHIGA